MRFGYRLGLAFLRIAWVGSLTTFIPAIAFRIYIFAIFSGVQLFYYVFVLLADQLFPFPFFGLLDILCCLAFPLFWLYLVIARSSTTILRERADAVSFSAVWILFFSSLPYSLFKIVSTVRSRGKNLFARVGVTGVRRRKPASWTERLHVAGEALFGTELWRKRLPGEAVWVILGRGLFATCIAAVILVYAYYIIILETARQVALTPTIEIRTTDLPEDVVLDEDPAWNVVLVVLKSVEANATEVRSLNSTSGQPNSGSLCPLALTPWAPIFNCPLVLNQSAVRYYDNDRSLANYVSNLIVPDLLVTVNFTKLRNHTPRNSVQIKVGLTNDTFKVLGRTSPTTLIPGVNLVGFVNVDIRQVITKSALSIIGFETHETFLISEVVHVWPDPWASMESVLIPRAPDIATIRLIPQFPTPGSEWRIVQDHRDRSVLRGVSSTGGLWTALAGILAFLFGGSIMRTMFGVKPLSTSGLAHMFQGASVRNACIGEYPRIRQDANDTSPIDRGVTSLLCDHFIDLEYFVYDNDVGDPNVPLLLQSYYTRPPSDSSGELTPAPEH